MALARWLLASIIRAKSLIGPAASRRFMPNSGEVCSHSRIKEEGAQAKQENKDVILPTLSHRLQAFRQQVNQDRTQRIVNRIKDKKLKSKVKYYLLNEAAVAA